MHAAHKTETNLIMKDQSFISLSLSILKRNHHRKKTCSCRECNCPLNRLDFFVELISNKANEMKKKIFFNLFEQKELKAKCNRL